MRRYAIWGGVILALLLVIGMIISSLVSIGSSSPTGTTTPWFKIAAIVLIIGAIAAVVGRGGIATRWALGVIILALTVYFISGIIFGDRAPEVLKKAQDEASSAVLDASKDAGKKSLPTPTPSVEGGEVVLQVSTTWSKPVFGAGDNNCFQWWATRPEDKNRILAEVMVIGNSKWITWEEFTRLKNPKIEWVQFRSTDGVARVTHRILPRKCS